MTQDEHCGFTQHSVWKAQDRLRWHGTNNDVPFACFFFVKKLVTLWTYAGRLRVKRHPHLRSHSPPTGQSGHALLPLMTCTHAERCLWNRLGPGCWMKLALRSHPVSDGWASAAGSWVVRGMGVSVMTGVGFGVICPWVWAPDARDGSTDQEVSGL